MNKTIFNVILLTMAILLFIPSMGFSQNIADEIDKLMLQYQDYGQFNGTVLVAENGEVIFKKGYGLANMDWNISNEVDTKFKIASITKQFTSMLIMQLVKEGKVKLDGKITDYLSDYRKDTGEKVTIHHLLTHTSGIPSFTNLPGFWSDSTRKHYETDYMVKNLHSGDLEFEPGSEFKYNNTGYALLAVIIEKVTNKSFEENLQERIFNPLKMNNSGVDRNERILDNRANGYLKQGVEYVNAPYGYMLNTLGAGDMYSTVEDLYLWDQALYTKKLLSEKYKKIMFTPFLENYAYGWGVYKVALGESTDSVQVVTHSGGIPGFRTRIFRIIKDKHLIVVLNNTGITGTNEMCEAITNILYDKPYELPKLSIADTIYQTILESGAESAVKQYHKLKADHQVEYNFKEYELNTLGYQLLGMKKVKEAIEIFKLNVAEYPEAFNPYDSLGEAYMIDGEKELAIKNYAKSLEINPENIGAIKMLGKVIQAK